MASATLAAASSQEASLRARTPQHLETAAEVGKLLAEREPPPG